MAEKGKSKSPKTAILNILNLFDQGPTKQTSHAQQAQILVKYALKHTLGQPLTNGGHRILGRLASYRSDLLQKTRAAAHKLQKSGSGTEKISRGIFCPNVADMTRQSSRGSCFQ